MYFINFRKCYREILKTDDLEITLTKGKITFKIV